MPDGKWYGYGQKSESEDQESSFIKMIDDMENPEIQIYVIDCHI